VRGERGDVNRRKTKSCDEEGKDSTSYGDRKKEEDISARSSVHAREKCQAISVTRGRQRTKQYGAERGGTTRITKGGKEFNNTAG